jgi:putative membrane protein
MINKSRLPSPATILIYLTVIYVVGVVGMLTKPIQPYFIFLVPVNIVLVLLVSMIYHPYLNPQFIITAIVMSLCGFLLEWIGVKTGLIFGEYEYHGGLGIRLDGVPLIMGLNWFLLVYGTSLIGARLFRQNWLIAFIGASLMVVYDVFLEPAAIRYHFWMWTDGQVPWQNYLAWFISAFVFIYLFRIFIVKHSKNPVAEGIFWLQLGFFITLWIGNNLSI